MARRSKYSKDYDLFAFAEDNRPSIVYMATNVMNGKRYIGMTRQTLQRREGQHIASALRGADKYSIFHKAIRKYGEAAFHFEIIAEYPSYMDAARAEIRLIAEMKPEYNLGIGGEAVPNVGYRLTAASREKMRRSLLANPTRYWLGKKRPDIAAIQRRRLKGNTLHTTPHTAETRAKISAAKRAAGPCAKHIEAMARRRKTILCLNDGRTFIGSKAAAEALGFRQDYILGVLRGRHPHAGGFRLQYVE